MRNYTLLGCSLIAATNLVGFAFLWFAMERRPEPLPAEQTTPAVPLVINQPVEPGGLLVVSASGATVIVMGGR